MADGFSILEELFYLLNEVEESKRNTLFYYYSSLGEEDPYQFCEKNFGCSHKAIDDAKAQMELFWYCNMEELKQKHDSTVDDMIFRARIDHIGPEEFMERTGNRYDWDSVLILYLFLESEGSNRDVMFHYLHDSYETAADPGKICRVLLELLH